MNKYILGAIGLSVALSLLAIGLVLSAPKGAVGSVSYDKTYLSELNVSGDATIDGTLTYGGVATSTPNPKVTTISVSGLSSLAAVTASGLATLQGAATVGTTLGVTGTTTLSGQVGIAKCMTALSSYGQTLYITYASTSLNGAVVVTSTKPSVCY